MEGAVSRALVTTMQRCAAAASRRAAPSPHPPRLVAVSKTKPVELLQEAYGAGQRVFGENYVQELVDKAPSMPADVQWHFIGHLQSNKAKFIARIPNVVMVETVDTPKLADTLNRACAAENRTLGVMVQVNTSGEETKHGVEPQDAAPLAQHIVAECPALTFAGLMTIGMPDYTSRPENFITLQQCRAEVASALGVEPETLELSMGMSGDFEQAIEMGSTNVRVGSTIFGAREYKAKEPATAPAPAAAPEAASA